MDEIFKRISVRKFQDKPVEQEKIDWILKAAMQAPSAGNQQPWEYFVVRDRDTIKELSKCSPFTRCAAGAPVVIVPCLKSEGLRFPELGEIDLAITTEHILLEIVSQGLGGVWARGSSVKGQDGKSRCCPWNRGISSCLCLGAGRIFCRGTAAAGQV